jgi:RNA polymerase sigma-70 factor (ECF subfamily)
MHLPLATRFLAARPATTSPRQALEAELTTRLQQAQGAWGDLDVPTERAVAWWADRAPIDGDLAALHTNDLFLASALADGNRAALQLFEKRVMTALDPVLIRLRLQPADLDEVKQRTRDATLVSQANQPAGINGYDGRGPLTGWLRVVATRLALKLDRAKTVGVANDDAIFAAAAAPDDVELQAIKLRHGPTLQASFDQALRALSAREKNLLRQHLVDDLSIDEMVPLYGVHRATVARWIAMAKTHLLELTREALQDRLQIDSRECDSLILALQSQLRVSLRISMA